MDIIAILAENELSFWGSILGSIIGVVGAFAVGMVAIMIERQSQKSTRQKVLIRNHGDKIIELEIFLIQYTQTQLKNERLLKQCTELTSIGSFTITLPRVLQRTIMRQGDIINRQLLNEVVSLEMAMELNNQLIEDFVNYYKSFSAFLMPIISQNQAKTLDQKTIENQHTTMLSFAEATRKSVIEAYERSIKVLALVQLNGEAASLAKFTKIKPISELEFGKKSTNAKIKQLKKIYNQKMFSDPSAEE